MNSKSRNFAVFAAVTINVVLIVGFIAFEVFNVITTKMAFEDILKSANMAIVAAIAFAATDIGGLARIFTPQKGKEEPAFIWAITGAWLVVACFNAFFTWWTIALIVESGIRAPSAMQPYMVWVPVMFAVCVFLVHITVIYTLGVALDVAIHGGVRTGTPIGQALHIGNTHVARPVSKPAPIPSGQMYRPAPTPVPTTAKMGSGSKVSWDGQE